MHLNIQARLPREPPKARNRQARPGPAERCGCPWRRGGTSAGPGTASGGGGRERRGPVRRSVLLGSARLRALGRCHGPQEAAPAHRRHGQEDPRVPGAEGSAAGFSALRRGLRDHAAAADAETAARAGLGGRAEREPAVGAALPPAALRRGPHRHPQVLAVGARRALLLGHHQGEGGLHSRGTCPIPPAAPPPRRPPPSTGSSFSLQNMDHGRAWGYLTFKGKTGSFSHTWGQG